MSRVERVLEMTREILSLEQEIEREVEPRRARINEIKDLLAEMIGDDRPSTVDAKPRDPRPEAPSRAPAARPASTRLFEAGPLGPAQDRILKILDDNPERSWTAAEVQEKVPDLQRNTVATWLNRLKRNARIQRVARGYQSLQATSPVQQSGTPTALVDGDLPL